LRRKYIGLMLSTEVINLLL